MYLSKKSGVFTYNCIYIYIHYSDMICHFDRIHSYVPGLHESLEGPHHNEWTSTTVNIANGNKCLEKRSASQ